MFKSEVFPAATITHITKRNRNLDWLPASTPRMNARKKYNDNNTRIFSHESATVTGLSSKSTSEPI